MGLVVHSFVIQGNTVVNAVEPGMAAGSTESQGIADNEINSQFHTFFLQCGM